MHPRDNPRYIVVELFDDAAMTAQQVASVIVYAMADARRAYPAFDDRFGRLVKTGTEATNRPIGSRSVHSETGPVTPPGSHAAQVGD